MYNNILASLKVAHSWTCYTYPCFTDQPPRVSDQKPNEMNIRYLKSASDFKATKFTTETKEEVTGMTAFNKAPKLKIRRQCYMDST